MLSTCSMYGLALVAAACSGVTLGGGVFFGTFAWSGGTGGCVGTFFISAQNEL